MVQEFAEALSATPGVEHVLKFYDEHLLYSARLEIRLSESYIMLKRSQKQESRIQEKSKAERSYSGSLCPLVPLRVLCSLAADPKDASLARQGYRGY